MPSHPSKSRVGRTWLWVPVLGLAIWSCGGDSDSIMDPGDPDPNQAPVAQAGADATVAAGLSVQLDGTGSSDPDGDAITYAWTLTAPSGSTAALDDASSSTPSFTPDVAGAYVAQLVVNDGEDDSAPDQVTVTAEDNTASANVDETGGEVVSKDGLVRMVFPAGAVDGPTEIRITRVGEGQVPEVVADLGWSGLTVYDLQPSGLTFGVPVEVTVERAGAVTSGPGEMTVEPAYVFAESEGALESLVDLQTVIHPSEPGTAVTTGGLGHFSSLARVEKAGILHRLTAPSSAEVEVPFTGTLSASIAQDSDGPFRNLESISVVFGRASERVDTLPGFVSQGVTGSFQTVTLENEYTCTEAGTGKLVMAVLPFILRPEGTAPLVSGGVYLETPIECTAPVDLDVTERTATRVFNVSTGRQDDEVLVGGGQAELWNVASNMTTNLGTDLGGDPVAHFAAVGQLGGFVAVTLFGSFYSLLDVVDDWVPIPSVWKDQMRQLARGLDGRVYGASGTGEARIFEADTETGAVSTLTYAINNLVAVAGEGETAVAVQVEGDGNPAFNNARLALLDFNLLTATALSGAVLGEVLDQYQRLSKDIACGVLTSTLRACLVTAGEYSPGFLTDGQTERDGLVQVVLVNMATAAAQSLERSRTPAVGASAFTRGGRAYVAWAEQASETIEVREITAAGTVGWSWSQRIDTWCKNVLDFAVTPSGEYAALSCVGEEGVSESKYVSLRIPPQPPAV